LKQFTSSWSSCSTLQSKLFRKTSLLLINFLWKVTWNYAKRCIQQSCLLLRKHFLHNFPLNIGCKSHAITKEAKFSVYHKIYAIALFRHTKRACMHVHYCSYYQLSTAMPNFTMGFSLLGSQFRLYVFAKMCSVTQRDIITFGESKYLPIWEMILITPYMCIRCGNEALLFDSMCLLFV
jgi:hypothetical protein